MLKKLIQEYFEGIITSQKLIAYILKNTLSSESVYMDYFSLKEKPICPICSKKKTYSGFKEGFICCKSHKSKEEISNKSDKTIISEVFELSKTLDYRSRIFGLKFKKYEQRLSILFQNKMGKELKYCIFNKINFTPTCSEENCGKNAIFGGYKRGYTYGCCMSHSIKSSPYAAIQTDESKESLSKKAKERFSKWSKEERKTHGTQTSNGIKKSLTCNRNLFVDANKKRVETCLIKYGVENISQNENIKILKGETTFKNYGVTSFFTILNKDHNFRLHVRKTNIASGKWICDSKKSDFKLYSHLCRKYTKNNNLNELKNFHLRGAVEKNGYHLDHIFSISEGFKNNISPWIVGSLINLRMIPAKENIAKNAKSDISIEELFYKYFQTEMS